MQASEKSYYKSVIATSVVCAAGACALGVILYFLYEKSGGSFLISLISPIDKSMWESLKLFFVPFFAFSLIEYLIYGRSFGTFFYSKTLASVFGILFTVILHYTYLGVIGRGYVVIDAIIYVATVFLSFGISSASVIKAGVSEKPEKREIPSVFALIILLSAFFVLTYFKPSVGIFG